MKFFFCKGSQSPDEKREKNLSSDFSLDPKESTTRDHIHLPRIAPETIPASLRLKKTLNRDNIRAQAERLLDIKPDYYESKYSKSHQHNSPPRISQGNFVFKKNKHIHVPLLNLPYPSEIINNGHTSERSIPKQVSVLNLIGTRKNIMEQNVLPIKPRHSSNSKSINPPNPNVPERRTPPRDKDHIEKEILESVRTGKVLILADSDPASPRFANESENYHAVTLMSNKMMLDTEKELRLSSDIVKPTNENSKNLHINLEKKYHSPAPFINSARGQTPSKNNTETVNSSRTSRVLKTDRKFTSQLYKSLRKRKDIESHWQNPQPPKRDTFEEEIEKKYSLFKDRSISKQVEKSQDLNSFSFREGENSESDLFIAKSKKYTSQIS